MAEPRRPGPFHQAQVSCGGRPRAHRRRAARARRAGAQAPGREPPGQAGHRRGRRGRRLCGYRRRVQAGTLRRDLAHRRGRPLWSAGRKRRRQVDAARRDPGQDRAPARPREDWPDGALWRAVAAARGARALYGRYDPRGARQLQEVLRHRRQGDFAREALRAPGLYDAAALEPHRRPFGRPAPPPVAAADDSGRAQRAYPGRAWQRPRYRHAGDCRGPA